MYLFSVLSPLIGGFFNISPVARLLGHRGSIILAISCMFIAFFSSAIVYSWAALLALMLLDLGSP